MHKDSKTLAGKARASKAIVPSCCGVTNLQLDQLISCEPIWLPTDQVSDRAARRNRQTLQQEETDRLATHGTAAQPRVPNAPASVPLFSRQKPCRPTCWRAFSKQLFTHTVPHTLLMTRAMSASVTIIERVWRPAGAAASAACRNRVQQHTAATRRHCQVSAQAP